MQNISLDFTFLYMINGFHYTELYKEWGLLSK